MIDREAQRLRLGIGDDVDFDIAGLVAERLRGRSADGGCGWRQRAPP